MLKICKGNLEIRSSDQFLSVDAIMRLKLASER